MKIQFPSGFAVYLTSEEATRVSCSESSVLIVSPCGEKKIIEVPKSWMAKREIIEASECSNRSNTKKQDKEGLDESTMDATRCSSISKSFEDEENFNCRVEIERVRQMIDEFKMMRKVDLQGLRMIVTKNKVDIENDYIVLRQEIGQEPREDRR